MDDNFIFLSYLKTKNKLDDLTYLWEKKVLGNAGIKSPVKRIKEIKEYLNYLLSSFEKTQNILDKTFFYFYIQKKNVIQTSFLIGYSQTQTYRFLREIKKMARNDKIYNLK